jgi:uncharacterized cupredoxin-like copper-binding protein
MRAKVFVGLVVAVSLLVACGSNKTGGNKEGFSTEAALPGASPSSAAPSGAPATGPIAVTLGETDPTHMFINMSATSAVAGKVTFLVTNTGSRKHEFVVLSTATPADQFPIVSFEGEKDRIDEEAPGVTNVGETGDMNPGQTKALTIDMAAGHFAVVCNLPGHYRMGMHQDFTVVAAAGGGGPITVSLGETDPSHMFIHLSATSAPAGSVTFQVTNGGTRKHEFVVLSTSIPADQFPIVSFEGEKDRIDEEAPGVTNVGETGDMKPGETKTLTIDMAAGHFAVVCNLPGHYRMGMHQDFTVTPATGGSGPITVSLGETDPSHMFIHLSATSASAGSVTFQVTNGGSRKHEFVVLATDTPADQFPIVSFEGEKDRIDEDAAGVTNVGETGDMKPGETKTLTIDLAAGHYALVCNLPGHYRMGMHQDFTVS